MKRIILITGGQRSGKSVTAERMALSMSDNPVYLATAHIWDDEFRERVRIHQMRRGPEWTNIEEEVYSKRFDYIPYDSYQVHSDNTKIGLDNNYYANYYALAA